MLAPKSVLFCDNFFIFKSTLKSSGLIACKTDETETGLCFLYDFFLSAKTENTHHSAFLCTLHAPRCQFISYTLLKLYKSPAINPTFMKSLPSVRRLQSIRTKTSQHKNSFVSSAVVLSTRPGTPTATDSYTPHILDFCT